MVRIIVCIVVLTFWIGWSSPSPGSRVEVDGDPSLDVKDQVLRGIELTILTDFENAKKIYNGIIQKYPEEPIGYFYMAAVSQSEMLDEEDFTHTEEFQDFVEKCIRKSTHLQNQREHDPWLLFYEGNAYLYQSFLKSKLGKWWGAYRDAGKGVNRLQRALEIDSTFYDAKLGIGSYKYWKSTRIQFITWLPFVADEREAGIRMVRTAIEQGQYSNLIGRDQLAWILLDAGRLKEAEEYALQNYNAYPQSRFFQWTLVEVLYRLRDWDRAYRIYDSLLHAEQQIPNRNHYNEVECLLKMAEIDFERGNFFKADSLVTKLFNIQMEPSVRERARSRLKRALKIRLDCAQFLSRQDAPNSR